MKRTILFISIISIIFPESGHLHNHSHENEFGIAIGIVPGHKDEDDNFGLHLHYVKGIGEHNDFGIGISIETIFDEHKHNSLSVLGTYHFENGFTSFLLVLVWSPKGALSGSFVGVRLHFFNSNIFMQIIGWYQRN